MKSQPHNSVPGQTRRDTFAPMIWFLSSVLYRLVINCQG